MPESPRRPVIYLFGAAAPPVLQLPDVVRSAQGRGWDVAVGLTPTAYEWLEERVPELEELTGYPVKSAYRRPGQPDVLPPADAVLFAPATFNSVNSMAIGITTSWVVGFTAEAPGKGIPVVVMPCANSALAAHPQFDRSVAVLREARMQVLYGESGFEPNTPGVRPPYPWAAALDAVGQALL
ncbi:flavoprotein [Kitasatospora sp. CB01950]|uniref:flavoprotein n=1 Tax=Kitasatospora sp. CB01950 TaxID=1703930 RepID=UPI00093BC4B9|nr:flavoprotein [Kitasatospora sp. CB01950]OKJ06834.1 flavoprotein [Kitasatospora sp. CB01950]